MNSSNDPICATPSSVRSKWQFSLLSLMVLLLIGCLVLGYVGERRRRQQTEMELRRKFHENILLRAELGQLEEDPKLLKIANDRLVHVRAIPIQERNSWAWRIYLPPGKQWRLGISQGETWDEVHRTFPANDDSSPADLTGEVTIEAWIVEHANGPASLVVRKAIGRRQSISLPRAGLMVLRTQSGNQPDYNNQRVAGIQRQDVFATDGRIELLHWVNTLESDFPAGEHHTLPGETIPLRSYGISIYVEEVGD